MSIKSGILQQMRLVAGLSQKQLAKRLGVAQAAVSQTESRGDEIKLSTVFIWADAMGCEVSVKATLPTGEVIRIV